ncbi:MAG: hypothetical protein HYZ91_06440 [Candidatus Omnitrophica bacterium]|nr:hypothetical protein [Candidatus Omnitrophota bacterium]
MRAGHDHASLRGLAIGLIWMSTCAIGPAEAARLESRDGLPIVHLSGRPYEIGYQHGQLLGAEVRAAVGRVLQYFRSYLRVPLIDAWAANWWLDTAWRQATPFLPPDDVDELRGLADGSGVPLQELFRLHAIPDRTYACSNFAAWGRATAGGRLVHVRNLDWNTDAGIQQFAAIFIVHPTGKRAVVNVGWAGFIGVLTGVNDAQISIGQVGAETLDASVRGEPMALMMRRVLEEAGNLDEAAQVVRQAHRTVGVNYVVADAKARRAIVLETTHRDLKVFEANDPAEHRVSYARPLVDAVFRADTAVDPIIRDRQIASGGDPRRPGLESPEGSAYEVRYLGQAAGLSAHFGTLDGLTAQDIARAVAPPSNIQSVVMSWPDLWVANASGKVPAAQTTYRHFDLPTLLAPDR